MFYIGFYRGNVKKSSCLKPQRAISLDIWFVASPSGPLPSLFKSYPWGWKWPAPGSNVLQRLIYRENVKKSSCQKSEGLDY